MFEPRDHCTGEHEIGYKIVIEYSKRYQDYMVIGCTLFNEDTHPYGRVSSSQDGNTLYFKSMQEAIASIVDYPEKGK